MPNLNGVLETALYVADVDRSVQFYQSIFPLTVMVQDHRFCALSVAGRQVLLLFRVGGSCNPMVVSGGTIPPHDGHGETHLAFSISAEEFSAWEECLRSKGVAIESIVRWPRGGRSLYFRDPDNHLVELATPGIWEIY